jgi:hypothetical protein
MCGQSPTKEGVHHTAAAPFTQQKTASTHQGHPWPGARQKDWYHSSLARIQLSCPSLLIHDVPRAGKLRITLYTEPQALPAHSHFIHDGKPDLPRLPHSKKSVFRLKSRILIEP